MKQFFMLKRFFPLKKALTIGLIGCLSMAQAQDTLFEESFDFPALFPPMGWTNVKIAGTGSPGTWTRTTTGGSPIQEPFSDPAEAKFNSYFYAAGTVADLSTPVIDFTATGTKMVSFMMYRDPGFGTDKIEVYVNTTQSSIGGTLIGTVNRRQTLSPAEAAEGWYNYTFTVPTTFNTATNYIIFKATSGYGFNIFLDNVAIINDPVVGPPTCDVVISPIDNATGVCPNVDLSWDIVPYATGYKITLGNNPPNYNNVANNLDLGNALSYSALLATGTNYKWRVRPYNGNGTATGCVSYSFTTAATPCWCPAQYIQPSCSSFDFIDDFYTTGAVSNLSHLNSGCSPDSANYYYYSGFSATVNEGASFNVFMQSGPDYEQGYAVWIDWNQDGDFDDASEYAFNSGTATTGLVSGVITVPGTALLGTTRMRVRCFFNQVPTATQACDLWNEGETQDYDLIITTCTFVTYYQDSDGDGYGNAAVTTTSCTGAPAGYSALSTDCNDANAIVYPTAPELCNGLDENCNGLFDDNAAVAIITPSGPTSVCKGTSLILYANTGAGYTYQWFRNAATLAGATNSSYSVTKSGNYSVKVTVPGGCFATSATTTCTVNANPTATISNPEGLNLCGLPDLDLVANAGAGFTYIWYKNGAIISGATSQIYTTATTGDFRVKVTNAAGCSKSSSIKSVINVCREGEAITGVTVYPNPTSGAAFITGYLGDTNEASANIELWDMTGKHILTSTVVLQNGAFSAEISTADIAAGVYNVRIVADGMYVSRQLVVAK